MITLEPGFRVDKTANFWARIVSPHIYYSTFAENTFLESKILKSLPVSNDEAPWNSSSKDEFQAQQDSAQQHQNSGDCLSLYPNPTTGPVFVNLKCNLDEYNSRVVRVQNIMGIVVFEKSVKPGVNELDISMLPSGVYYLQLIESQISYTVRLVKI
jgi:hypothetical protein